MVYIFTEQTINDSALCIIVYAETPAKAFELRDHIVKKIGGNTSPLWTIEEVPPQRLHHTLWLYQEP